MHDRHATLRPVPTSIDAVEQVPDLHDLRLTVINAVIRACLRSEVHAREKGVLELLRFHLDRWLVNQDLAERVTVSVIVQLYEDLRPIALVVAESTVQARKEGGHL